MQAVMGPCARSHLLLAGAARALWKTRARAFTRAGSPPRVCHCCNQAEATAATDVQTGSQSAPRAM
eukprot:70257-Alexandrium_andersonii.AAC.1